MHPPDVGGLAAKVELTAKGDGEVLDSGRHVEQPPKGRPIGCFLCEHLEEAHLLEDVLLSGRALDLHNDPFARFQCRRVDLRDGASSQWLRDRRRLGRQF